jgi:hypothetical protein
MSTTVPVRDVFPYMQECDLLKIDIEGGEWGLLADPRFASTSAKALVMEVHPEARPEGAELEELLSEWRIVQRSPVDGVTELVWAVHRAHEVGQPAFGAGRAAGRKR